MLWGWDAYYLIDGDDYPICECILDKVNNIVIDIENHYSHPFLTVINGKYILFDDINFVSGHRCGYVVKEHFVIPSELFLVTSSEMSCDGFEYLDIIFKILNGETFPDGNELTNDEYLQLVSSSNDCKERCCR